ncbi:MAG: baseplate J/gp47 family protein [Clostridia bacterium]|nr:baseplate J/gp47 family protein [Clostridia bacterium]
MSETSTHYINYDPDEIWKLIQLTYISEGGDILYPGDEKEILLRSVLALMVQGFAIVDNALLMDSLQHTMDNFMDIYGSKRSCYRIEAQAAEAEVEIVFTANMVRKTIPAGTALTADGQRIYLTQTDLEQTGYGQTSRIRIVAEESGVAGNGLIAGTEMQFCAPNAAVMSITATESATGGRDRESDDNYRERIQEYGLASITTGPRQRYEQVARSVSADVLDAKAVHIGPCSVCVYLIVEANANAEAIKTAVTSALSEETERPLTDLLTVSEAEEIPYLLSVNVTLDSGMTGDALDAVVKEYQAWQDNEIWRPFNPDRLVAKLYQAGVSRVQWAEESHFNGGAVEYTTIEENQRCVGEIVLNVTT